MKLLKAIGKELLKEYTEDEVNHMLSTAVIEVSVQYTNGVRDVWRIMNKPVLKHIESKKPIAIK